VSPPGPAPAAPHSSPSKRAEVERELARALDRGEDPDTVAFFARPLRVAGLPVKRPREEDVVDVDQQPSPKLARTGAPEPAQPRPPANRQPQPEDAPLQTARLQMAMQQQQQQPYLSQLQAAAQPQQRPPVQAAPQLNSVQTAVPGAVVAAASGPCGTAMLGDLAPGVTAYADSGRRYNGLACYYAGTVIAVGPQRSLLDLGGNNFIILDRAKCVNVTRPLTVVAPAVPAPAPR
jgi:hypothetical protein